MLSLLRSGFEGAGETTGTGGLSTCLMVTGASAISHKSLLFIPLRELQVLALR